VLGQNVSLQRHEGQHLDQEQGGDQRLDQPVQDGTPETIASGLAQARAGSTQARGRLSALTSARKRFSGLPWARRSPILREVSHVTIGRLQGALLRPFEDAGVVLSSGRTEHLQEDEHCPDCGALLILVGRSHLCRPRQAVTKPPVTKSGGRPPIGEKAMTGAERMRKLRATRRALAYMRTV
jgi:hypothetical protein